MPRSRLALALVLLCACTDGDTAQPTTTTTTSSTIPAGCLAARRIGFKVLGPPGPENIVVTPDHIALAVYARDTANAEVRHATPAPGEFEALLPTACAQQTVSKSNEMVGYNVFLDVTGDDFRHSPDLSGVPFKDLDRLAFMEQLNALTHRHFGRRVLAPAEE